MFETAGEVEDLVWTMRLADFPRGENRALIDNLFNGFAPYSRADAEQLNLAVNVNFLEGTEVAHEARGQYASAFDESDKFFTVNLDSGPIHKRGDWSTTITKEINKRLKRSLPYFEGSRSTWANVVLHGIGPKVWYDRERWCPRAKGVEDVLVPNNTFLSMENLSLFAVRESYTPMQLIQMTSGPNRDPGWNMDLVNTCIAKCKEQILEFGLPWKEIMSPEKQAERIKQNSGLFAADSLSTIDCVAFYFWDDSMKREGWKKRIILEADYTMGVGPTNMGNAQSKYGTRDAWLFNPGNRIYANKWQELIHWQFADLSAVGPFRYHSVRSLGFLLYAICNIQNRLRCQFLDATFEQLMQYFRVQSKDDLQRALQIDLVNKGYIDESVKFVPPSERWKIDNNVAELAMNMNDSIINRKASLYRDTQQFGGKSPEKTATQIMAEVNRATTLISTGLKQSYRYSGFEYVEIARRFTIPNSKDADVRKFRVACLNAGVPKKYLDDVDCWEIEPEKTVGAGNRMMKMAIGDKLMSWFQLFSPEAQRSILHQATLWITEDAAWSNELVPKQNAASPSVHQAQVMMGSLMQGLPVQPTPEQNYVEMAQVLLAEAGMIISRIQKLKKGMPSVDEFLGLSNVAKHIAMYVQLVGRDKNSAPIAKQLAQGLGQLQNELKAYGQRLQEAAQAQQKQNGGLDAETKVKLAGKLVLDKAKAQNARESHAQRTALRQTQAQLELEHDAEKHAQELQFEANRQALEIEAEKQKAQAKEKEVATTQE